MKILAIEKEIPGIREEDYLPHLAHEAREVWKLKMEEVLREAYFTSNHEAILILECSGQDEAQNLLMRLPLVRNGLITFMLYELHPYDGFDRLFKKE